MKLGVASLVMSSVLLACAADPMVPLNENTQRTCPDGTVCPNWMGCPNLSTPGRCEYGDMPTPSWSGAKKPVPGWCVKYAAELGCPASHAAIELTGDGGSHCICAP
jgi:hypothetical protein